jgi:hypothetical protein
MSWRLYKDNTNYTNLDLITDEYATYQKSMSLLEHTGGVARLGDGWTEPHPITLRIRTSDGLWLWKRLREYIAEGVSMEFSLRYPYNGSYDLPLLGATGWYQFLYPKYGQVVLEHYNPIGIGSIVAVTLYPMNEEILRRDTGGIFDPTVFVYAMPPW